jgi:CheY-like chemotaxis protein
MSLRKRILCVSNDAALLSTRTMLLENAGFEVVPAFGFAEAMERCSADASFDLILMGQTVSPKDKRALISTLRELKCHAPILSVGRLGDAPLAEVDFTVESQAGPVALIEAVKAALGMPKDAQSQSKIRSQARKL